MALVSPAQAPASITAAIRKASDATGTNFDYLLTTAARESNFKPHAKAKTSSAAGLFQFIESTWLQTVKEQGGRYGLEKYSPHIFQTESGRYFVPNKEIRSEIIALRHNPEVSALMAGAFTQQNADYVGSRLGREPTQGELYIAHFLGASGATKLITLASKDPNARADTHFPRAASANKPIFYSHRQARSVRQVYDQLVKDHSQFGAMTLAVSSPIRSRPAQAGMEAQVQAKASPPLPAGNMPEAMPASMMIGAGENQSSSLMTQSVPPVSRTRVAALTHSPIPVNGTMTDAGLGGIGSWHTILLRDAAPSQSEQAVSASSPGTKPEAEAASGPANVPLRTRLHPGAPAGMTGSEAVRSAPSRAEAPQAEISRARILPNFATRFWELQALHGS